MFDKKKAQKKLRAFVENQTFTIAQKADMMVATSTSRSSPRARSAVRRAP